MGAIFGHCDNCRTMLKNALPKFKNAPHEAMADDPKGLALAEIIHRAIEKGDGWIGFDAFMALALYTPWVGYYAHGSNQFGTLPADAMRDRSEGGVGGAGSEVSEGSDFATAPEMTPLFGQTLAAQVAQALQATHTAEVWEFGAGTGALALQILDELARLHVPLARYTIVDVSGSLRARQQHRLLAHGDTVRWADALPEQMQGVVVGNEVLDAMPVKLLARKNGVWFERGVALARLATFGACAAQPSPLLDPAHRARDGFGTNDADATLAPSLAWADRPTDLRPPLEVAGPHDYLTEIHPQAEAFIRTLADKLTHGAAFFLDYGFPEAEYYHPQRHMGTVMCHRQHRTDPNPLADAGLKDITAHINFTGLAMAGQDAGFDVLGYCTQARFLMNCGLLTRLEAASFSDKVMAQKLVLEHEMGELFKVIAFAKGTFGDPMGFAQGDRTHTL